MPRDGSLILSPVQKSAADMASGNEAKASLKQSRLRSLLPVQFGSHDGRKFLAPSLASCGNGHNFLF
jgi:hypothetical protein